MSEAPDLNAFIELGFLDAKVTPRRRQTDAELTPARRRSDAPKTETKTETKTKTDGAVAPTKNGHVISLAVIKLNADDLALWRRAYPQLDLEGELVARDAWLAEQPPNIQKRWYGSTAKYLANQNAKAKAAGVSRVEKQTLNAFGGVDPEF